MTGNTRPSFVRDHNKPNQLQLKVPPGWLIIIGGISRKPYTQVLRIQDPQQPDDDKYLTSLPKKIKDGMMIESDDSDSASFMPTTNSRTLNVEFYFRLIEVMERGSDLVDCCSKSACLDIIEGSKPPTASAHIPDFYTLTVFVGDTNRGKFEDAVATLYFIKKPFD